MDPKRIPDLEKLFYEKIRLLNDLVACHNDEREALISVDLDQLWQIAGEKEKIAEQVAVTRTQILAVVVSAAQQSGLETGHEVSSPGQKVELGQILEVVPREHRAMFQKLYLSVVRLKSELKVIREENMIYIKDSLQFLDEMITSLTEAAVPATMYDKSCHYKSMGTNLMLSREV